MKKLPMINTILAGKYKGYKIVFDRNKNNIHLCHKKQKIDLKGKIKKAYYSKSNILGLGCDFDIYHFELNNEKEKISCITDFHTYLLLLIYGMSISPECVLGSDYKQMRSCSNEF